MICQLCHCTLPGHKVDLQPSIHCDTDVTVDTLGECFKGATDPIWQPKGQLALAVPSSWSVYCTSSYASRSCYCLPDRRNISPLFFCFLCYLSAHQPFGSGVCVKGISIRTWEAAGQKKEGKEDNKTIIFSGTKPLLLIIFLPQKRCVWFSVTYFESANGGLKWNKNLELFFMSSDQYPHTSKSFVFAVGSLLIYP